MKNWRLNYVNRNSNNPPSATKTVSPNLKIQDKDAILVKNKEKMLQMLLEVSEHSIPVKI